MENMKSEFANIPGIDEKALSMALELHTRFNAAASALPPGEDTLPPESVFMQPFNANTARMFSAAMRLAMTEIIHGDDRLELLALAIKPTPKYKTLVGQNLMMFDCINSKVCPIDFEYLIELDPNDLMMSIVELADKTHMGEGVKGLKDPNDFPACAMAMRGKREPQSQQHA